MKASILALALCLPLGAEGFVPMDKQGHAIAGAVIATAGCMTAQKLGWKRPEAYGFALALAAGCLKEAYDRRHPNRHTCDFNDISATALGGAVVSVSWRF